MQKIKNPILCWIVILAVFIRPTPAQAIVPLAAVAVGAVIAATGVMVAGAGVYKPPTFDQANAVVDSVTGDITRKVVVARMFGDGVTAGLKGFASAYTLDFPSFSPTVASSPSTYPAISPALLDSWRDYNSAAPAVGDVFWAANGTIKKVILTRAFSLNQSLISLPGEDAAGAFNRWAAASGYYLIGGNRAVHPYFTSMIYAPYEGETFSDGSIRVWFSKDNITCANTTLDAYPVPKGDYRPGLFAKSFPATEAAQDDSDRIAVQNPSAIKSMPQAITPEQYAEAAKQASAEMAQANADIAKQLADAHPDDVVLQAAANAAQALADQAKIDASAQEAILEATKPEEIEKTDTPPPAGPALDQDLQIDLSPFLGLKDKAMGKFPFSAVASLGSIFSGLTADPVTPSMDMPMPWGLPAAKISLSKWDDFAVKWRFLIAMMFHASCIYAIVRRYT